MMARCRNPPRRYKGYRIVYPEKMPDKRLGGINCYAAKDPYWGLPYPHPCGTILIDPNQGCPAIRATIRHEIIEKTIMEETGLPYKEAHRLTEKIEKVIK